MRAAVLYYPREIIIENRPEPQPGPNDVKIAVRVSGICGTDLHYYEGRYHPTGQPFQARVLGHGFAGVVSEVGSNVTDLKPGDRVTADPARSCGQCAACRAGAPNLCPKWTHMGMGIDGCLQDYVVADRRYVIPLPDSVTDEQASVLEPVAVALQVFRRLENRSGDETVVIIGAGPIGLAVLQVAKMHGHKVVVAEIVPERLMFAEQLGADYCIDPGEGDTAARILECCGDRPNLVVETAGRTPSAQLAFASASWHGRLVFVALPAEPMPLRPLLSHEVWVTGARSGMGSYEDAIRLVEDGRIVVDPMVSHRFPLDDLQQAFEMVIARPGDVLRVAIEN